MSTFSNQLVVYGMLPPSAINKALNKPASGSTPCASNEGPDKAVDGTVVNNSKWCSNVAGPLWLQVDLGTVNTVSSVVIHHAGDGNEPATWNTRDFNIQTSVDGTTWTTVATVAGNTNPVTTHAFAATSARYIKLNVITPTSDGNPAARIYELEVYGSAIGSPSTTPTPTSTATNTPANTPTSTSTSTPAQAATSTATNAPANTPTRTPTITPTPVPSSVNLALNKAASGSTPCTSGEEPPKAVDGSLSSKWCSLASGTKVLQVDFGASTAISRVIVRHAQAGNEAASWNTRDFNIQTSGNGKSWTTVATVTGNTAAVTTHTFNARSARYVRLNVVTPTNDGNPAARIYEVEVYR